MSRLESKQRWGLGTGGILLTLLLAAVFTLGSLDVPFHPKSWREVMVLYAVSSFVTAALLVFLVILGRTTLRLWVERRREQLGARFKTKMVVGAMALSLLPIVFMFIVSYSLINRSLLLWFPKPLEIASVETQKLFTDLGRGQLARLRALLLQLQSEVQKPGDDFMQHAFAKGADAVWILDQNGKPVRGEMVCDDQPEDRRGAICMRPTASGEYLRSLEFRKRKTSGFHCGCLPHKPRCVGAARRNSDANSRVLSGQAGSSCPQAPDASHPSAVYRSPVVFGHVGGAVSRQASHGSHSGARRRHPRGFFRQL
jgi:hypothetical protein